MSELMRTCGDAGGVTRLGLPCRSVLNLSTETGRCVQHDPTREQVRRTIVSAGGKAAAQARRSARAALPARVPKAPKTIADAERFASWLTYAVTTGVIDARTAHEAAVCLREFRGASEKRILELEIKELRAELA